MGEAATEKGQSCPPSPVPPGMTQVLEEGIQWAATPDPTHDPTSDPTLDPGGAVGVGPAVGTGYSEQRPPGGDRGWKGALLAFPETSFSRKVQGCLS